MFPHIIADLVIDLFIDDHQFFRMVKGGVKVSQMLHPGTSQGNTVGCLHVQIIAHQLYLFHEPVIIHSQDNDHKLISAEPENPALRETGSHNRACSHNDLIPQAVAIIPVQLF